MSAVCNESVSYLYQLAGKHRNASPQLATRIEQVSRQVAARSEGRLELVPGLGLLFFDADLDPLYGPIERNEALVDLETPPLKIKFGVNYVASPGQ